MWIWKQLVYIRKFPFQVAFQVAFQVWLLSYVDLILCFILEEQF